MLTHGKLYFTSLPPSVSSLSATFFVVVVVGVADGPSLVAIGGGVSNFICLIDVALFVDVQGKEPADISRLSSKDELHY
uniref:Uncharacterized protein n=1 Tax=Romanomermis culicivorax TaxID=13658 RepID=A0A915KC69_ROMCU